MKYHRLNRAERYAINREIWRNVRHDSKALPSDDDTMAHLFIMAIIILIALAIVSMIG